MWHDEFAVLYREAALVARMAPRDVDDCEIWELAAVLGRNDPGAQREPWPDDLPSLNTMRRSFSKDGTVSSEPATDDEYALLLAAAKKGTRKGGGG